MTKKHPYDAAKQAQEKQPAGPDAPQENLDAPHAAPGEPMEETPPECPRCKAAEEAAAQARAEAADTRLRALAELDNTRKRLLREKEETTRYAAANVLTDILPALDNLDLALEHAKDNTACKDFLIGVEMTRKLLLEALKQHGLEPTGALGEPFDPGMHEAVNLVSHSEFPEGSICALLRRGYRLHERLLRPAQVVVCKK
jgi:molecular chaperone GrpE